MYGLTVCDYTAFPNRRDERSKQDFLASFDQGTEITLLIANETLKEKKRWFSQIVDVIATNSESLGFELWWTIVTKADQTSRGDYWGSVEFQDFFERSYDMRLVSTEDVMRFRDALKNTKRNIRRAEAKHKKVFEDLIIDYAFEAETLDHGPEKAKELRSWFHQDRSKHIAKFLKDLFEAHSNAIRAKTALLKVSTSPHRSRLRASLVPLLPSLSSTQEIE